MGEKPRYVCVHCSLPLSKERVLSIAHDEWHWQILVIAYHCECYQSVPLVEQFAMSAPHLHTLFEGHTISLPYINPFALRPIREDHPDVVRFRWRLTHEVDTLDDLKGSSG